METKKIRHPKKSGPAPKTDPLKTKTRAEDSAHSGHSASAEKIVCVIVNYNDAGKTRESALRIHDYSCLDHILLVDNGSVDGSFEKLNKISDDRITVLRSPHNGGYGAGNNLGIRYAAEKWNAALVLIANPDVAFSEDCVRELAEVFRRHPRVGIASVPMEQPGLGKYESAWPLHDFTRELLYMGPVSRRLLRRQLYYPNSYFAHKRLAGVDVVHGSMLMVSTKAFAACGGYDEKVFLYQEEAILATRMKQAGYRTALLLTRSYQHRHAVPTGSSLTEKLARQRLREDSVYYYLKNYLSAGPMKLLLARCWFLGIRAEIRLFHLLTFWKQ